MHPKRFIYLAGSATLILAGGAGILINYFLREISLRQLFTSDPLALFVQLFIGAAFTLISGSLLLWLLRQKMMDKTRNFFADLLAKYKVSLPDILFLSFCAGVGEELLFRAAIQHWLGIWITAFLFILLHGYLNPKNKPLFIYGTVLLIVSAGFGYLVNYAGLVAAMSAHFGIDVVLMVYLKRAKSTE